jgi:predicted DNA-binding transcriptional regulator AlpA
VRLLTKKQLREKVAYSLNHIQRLIEAKRFPAPLKPEGKMGRSLWIEGEVDDWIRQKLIERDTQK